MATIQTSRSRRVFTAAAPAPASPKALNGKEARGFKLASAVVLGLLALLWLLPTIWAIKTSLTSNATASLGAPAILSDTQLTGHSYSVLLGSGDLWNWYLASAITSAFTVILTVAFASMAAYPLSRMQFRGRKLVFLLVLAGIMVPTQVLVVPVFQELAGMGLLNTYWSVILPQVPAVVAVFIFKQFFGGLPRELEEAARVDGASYWRIYWSVILPLSRPVVSAVGILTFVTVWNNLILPLFTLSNPKLMTIPVGLATVQGSYGQRLADIQASAILGALPLVIIYFFLQRRIVEGVAGSGLKG
ncbi:carbohydrate ABC transporter permease [Sinomonas terrae]|uniref:Carbohydrate ABC transporter permease n=1 Tax=Sinomonas terrae TaxID=2908838 RepID=A0ABS9TYI3_9MICC|nr:carbohydrate ABC transporter permease [Sinomonas terrae]MCH6469507.1 carbohydrate ABC transporter permease [Sinomonas terrae]